MKSMKIASYLMLTFLFSFSVSGGIYYEQEAIFQEPFEDQAYIEENWISRGPNGCVGTILEDGYLSYTILNQPCLPNQFGADTAVLYTQLQGERVKMIEVHFSYQFPRMGEFGFAGWNPETDSAWSVSLVDSWETNDGQVKYVKVVDGLTIEDEKTGYGTIPTSGDSMMLRVTFDYAESTTAILRFGGNFEKTHTYFEVPKFTHFSVTFSIKVDYYSTSTVMKLDSYSEYYKDNNYNNTESLTHDPSEVQSSNSPQVNFVEQYFGIQTIILIGIGSTLVYLGKKQYRLRHPNKLRSRFQCNNCGTVNPELSIFCIECGSQAIHNNDNG